MAFSTSKFDSIQAIADIPSSNGVVQEFGNDKHRSNMQHDAGIMYAGLMMHHCSSLSGNPTLICYIAPRTDFVIRSMLIVRNIPFLKYRWYSPHENSEGRVNSVKKYITVV